MNNCAAQGILFAFCVGIGQSQKRDEFDHVGFPKQNSLCPQWHERIAPD